jgi:PPK2 family polyphosphate:nucleotide phosphotransferase
MSTYKIQPDSQVKLSDIDPDGEKSPFKDKAKIIAETTKLVQRLEILQELLYAEHKHRVLVILQGMDTSGKDGVVRHVFEGVNPQGVRVASFKVPTAEELAHDYLWRIHQQTPGKGEIVIFNRSHYEDVLVVRVHNIVPEKVWSKRFQQITEFEKTLAQEGTLILKFFLHIDKEEQKERLIKRLQDPTKIWKFNPGDLKERELWDNYIQAYEDVLNKTSTADAPWYVIPANKKWVRNYIIAKILVNALEGLNCQYPKPTFHPATTTVTFFVRVFYL